MKRRLVLLRAATLALPLAAAAVVLVPAAPPADARAFQRLVGGLGLGPAVDLSRCATEFDPRVARTCTWAHDPLPGGDRFCPCHAP